VIFWLSKLALLDRPFCDVVKQGKELALREKLGVATLALGS
jgi:hypothetical protein